jgi:hypothetical protein
MSNVGTQFIASTNLLRGTIQVKKDFNKLVDAIMLFKKLIWIWYPERNPFSGGRK